MQLFLFLSFLPRGEGEGGGGVKRNKEEEDSER